MNCCSCPSKGPFAAKGLCISPSDTQRVIKKGLEESGLMSSIKIDSACTDETTDYKSKQMNRLGRGRGETPFRQLSIAL